MLDFYKIVVKEKSGGALHVRPDWIVGRRSDLMTRGGDFFAVWDESKKLWSRDIYDVQKIVDADLHRYADELMEKTGLPHIVDSLGSNQTRVWDEFRRYLRNSSDSYHELDNQIRFASDSLRKEDYATKRLSYSLSDQETPAWDALTETLYSEEERTKIEWAIGSVFTGASRSIQKFLVFYGPPGSGKSTILNIVDRLFEGYTIVFDAKELTSSSNAFSTAPFKNNPLVAIQHDADLSKIQDNTKLNSIVSHEIMPVNEKYKAVMTMRANAMLFLGTNSPVKITDAKSGIIRRLIDVIPSQRTIERDLYFKLIKAIEGELGAIAQKCINRFTTMGSGYYSSYKPVEMMLQTDIFLNFIEAHFDIFKEDDGVTLKKAWDLYKSYCSETGVGQILPQYKLREELKNYFDSFYERYTLDGVKVRSYYSGFKHLRSPIVSELPIKYDGEYRLNLREQDSKLDQVISEEAAQYANSNGAPERAWSGVKTKLRDLDTSVTHYVKVPSNHIVIDFDLTVNGEKSLEKNIKAAEEFPPTYAEISNSGKGIHLHYIYNGDTSTLDPVYAEGIEVKVYKGNAALRRRLSKCNNLGINVIDSGLPVRESKTFNQSRIKSEQGLRNIIDRNLRKEIHAATKPSIDFINAILDDAYNKGLDYDVTDMRAAITTFAARSTNNTAYCLRVVNNMKFKGQNELTDIALDNDSELYFYDVEVYPNLLLVCYKSQTEDTVHALVNPEQSDIEDLLKHKLVGFNNRRYDNHILYARLLGYSNEQIFNLSNRMINTKGPGNTFVEAYNLSYADVYDFSSVKQSLKKFMLDLGLEHIEMDIPWDKPVPDDRLDDVIKYCKNDVRATQAVFESRAQDFEARKILAKMSGLTLNSTTQRHTAKIIFGDDRDPKSQFVYTDLSTIFPGYTFDAGRSHYKGIDPGEGGFVYSEPGYYENVAVLDIASMHPTSIRELNLFGPYTKRYNDITDARICLKHGDLKTARGILGDAVGDDIKDTDEDLQILAYALKIVINTVYGLTSAKFDNPFRDIRNKDNIVAKRGSLFMIDLLLYLQQQGIRVVHIKTDSVKIPGATNEIIKMVKDFGFKYGYEFEHEVTYSKMCLVNDAVYVALFDDVWTAVGAQFQHPYVFKQLFSREPLTFDDMCEMKSVDQGAAIYLDINKTGNPEDMIFIGRTGLFVPVICRDGGKLYRIKDEKITSISGTKDYCWVTKDMAKHMDSEAMLLVDWSYFNDLKTAAIEQLEKYVPLATLTGDQRD